MTWQGLCQPEQGQFPFQISICLQEASSLSPLQSCSKSLPVLLRDYPTLSRLAPKWTELHKDHLKKGRQFFERTWL